MAKKYCFKTYTYEDLRNGISFEDDPLGIATYEQESRCKTFLSNPVITYEDPFMYIAFADGIPVGRTMYYETRLKVNDQVLPLYSGSALEVAEAFRKEGLGADLFFNGQTIKKRNRLLSAGISDMALPLYKKLKFVIFEYPKLLMPVNCTPIVKRYGLPDWLASTIGVVINLLFRFYRSCESVCYSSRLKNYTVLKTETVPEWVDDIVLKDGHKYSEVHDHKWLQWNLDNNFKGHDLDIQSFYQVLFGSEQVGFFMTKERFRPDAQGMENVLIGSIVEWGVKKGSMLKDIDMFRMAVKTFSRTIDIVETATDNVVLNKSLKRMGFFHHGDAHIAFKDKTKELTDASDQSLWRIRYGYADVILT